jgi:hypothetical protein
MELDLGFSVYNMPAIQNMEEPGKSWAGYKLWHLASSSWRGRAVKCHQELHWVRWLWSLDALARALLSLQQFHWSGGAAVKPTAHLANSDIYWKHDGFWKEDCLISILSDCAGLGGVSWAGCCVQKQSNLTCWIPGLHPAHVQASQRQQCAQREEVWVVCSLLAACRGGEFVCLKQQVPEWYSCHFAQSDARMEVVQICTPCLVSISHLHLRGP